MPLEAGDLVAMGAPRGVAMGQPNAAELYLKPGDRMEIAIEGLMSLRSSIVAPPERGHLICRGGCHGPMLARVGHMSRARDASEAIAMIVIQRNGKTTVVTGWRAWLMGVAAFVALTA